MKNLFQRVNRELEKLGQIIAHLGISLIAIILMLAPGVVFALFLYQILGVLVAGQEMMPVFQWIKLIFLGICSWYIGRGLHESHSAKSMN